jgi:hypothetical protein
LKPSRQLEAITPSRWISRVVPLMMATEIVSEMLEISSELTLLIARERFIKI